MDATVPDDSNAKKAPKPDDSNAKKAPKPDDSNAKKAPKPDDSNAKKAPKPDDSNAKKAPKPDDSNAPKPDDSNAKKAPKPDDSNAKKAPKPDDSNAKKAPKPDDSNAKKAPKPAPARRIADTPSPGGGVKTPISTGLLMGLIAAVAVAAFFAGYYVSDAGSEGLTQEDLDDAMSKLELRLMQNMLPAAQTEPPVRISADNDPIIGNPDAPITIIEFSDFQCPFCARFSAQTLPLLSEQYIQSGTVKLVYRDFPIQSSHPNALPAAVAAECANDQGQFKPMHDTIFANQAQWGEQDTSQAIATFSQYAGQLQLDQVVFDTCLTTGKYVNDVLADLEDGRTYGVTGTPSFFIGNDNIGYVEITGAQPFESFKRVLDAQLGT